MISISPIWYACLEEAWAGYCAGSQAIGAVWVDSTGAIRYRGRGRIGEPQASAPFLAGTRLAHAEVNVLAQIPAAEFEQMAAGRLYTTLEPCPLCVGAITMSGVRQVTFAAYDHWAGATAWLQQFPYMAQKQIEVAGPVAGVEIISLVLLTDRTLQANSVRTPDLIRSFQQDSPIATNIGREFFHSGFLQQARDNRWPVEAVIEAIGARL